MTIQYKQYIKRLNSYHASSYHVTMEKEYNMLKIKVQAICKPNLSFEILYNSVIALISFPS